MSNTPKVSICIPSYNHARFLPAALDSALAQTYRDFEIVVVDDGSTDDSLQIAEGYAARYPSLIRVSTHPDRRNHGISATANLAIHKSRGTYWTGLPSDDVWYPEKLEFEVAYLEAHPGVALVYSQTSVIDANGTQRQLVEGIDISSDPDPLACIIQRNHIPAITVMVRSYCFKRVGLHDNALIYSDWDLWIRLMAHYRVGFIHRPLAYYRTHTYNSSVGIDPQLDFTHRLAVMVSLRRKASGIGGALSAPRRQALLDLQIAFFNFCLRRYVEASDGLISAFATDPTLRGDTTFLSLWLLERVQDFSELDGTLEALGRFDEWFLNHLKTHAGKYMVDRVARQYNDMRWRNAALKNYQRGDMKAAGRDVLRCFANAPRRLADREMLAVFAEAAIGTKAMSGLRRFRRQIFHQ